MDTGQQAALTGTKAIRHNLSYLLIVKQPSYRQMAGWLLYWWERLAAWGLGLFDGPGVAGEEEGTEGIEAFAGFYFFDLA